MKLLNKLTIAVLILFTLYTTFSYAIDTTDLAFYYSFDSDCVTDDTGNANDVTNDGADNIGGGKNNNACDFIVGNTDYIDASILISNHGFLPSENHTICAWFKLDDTNALYSIISISNSPYDMLYYSTGLVKWLFDVKVGATTNRVQGPAGNTSWSFYCLPVDNNGKIINAYMDGNIIGSDETNSLDESGLVSLYFGAFNDGGLSGYLNGIIDEISIWNTTLSEGDMNDLYNGSNGFFYPFGTGTTPSLTLYTNLRNSENLSFDDNPFTFNFNGSVTNNSELWYNCSFLINGTPIDTKTEINISQNHNFSLNLSGYAGLYNFSTFCIDENSSDDFQGTEIFIDIIEPNILIYEFMNNTDYYSDTNYYINLSVNDTNNAFINISVFDNTTGTTIEKWNYENDSLNEELHSFYELTNSSGWCTSEPCDMIFKVVAMDDHNPINKEVRYLPVDFGNDYILADGDIYIYGDGVKFGDEYTFFYLSDNKWKQKITFKENSKYHTFYINGSDLRLRNSEHLGHFYSVSLKRYIDFDSENIKILDITILENNNYKIDIELYISSDEIETETIGDLNINTVIYEFRLIERPDLNTALLTDINQSSYETNVNIGLIYNEIDGLGDDIMIIGMIILWLGLWIFGYIATTSFNSGLGSGMILLTIPIDVYFLINFTETNYIGSKLLGIGFSIMIVFTLFIVLLINRKSYKSKSFAR